MGPESVDDPEALMPTASILARYKNSTRQRFLEFLRQAPVVPPNVAVPRDAEEALKMGIRLGRQQGYSEGLVDGTQLGLDVGMETVDALLQQPVIFA